MKPKTLIMSLILLPALGGCVVGAVADLAATTVVTAGKLAVKGTGALIDAAIPDKDGKEDRKNKKKADQTHPAAQSGYTPQTPPDADSPATRPTQYYIQQQHQPAAGY